MAAEIIDFDARRIQPYLMGSIEQFLGDPPDSEFQRGYLAALLSVYTEGLGRGASDARVKAAEGLLETTNSRI